MVIMTELKNKLVQIANFLDEWPDEKRHPRVIQNPDWDILTPILLAWGAVREQQMHTGESLGMMYDWLRFIIEIVYCMGYEKGMQNASLPQFVLADKEEQNV